MLTHWSHQTKVPLTNYIMVLTPSFRFWRALSYVFACLNLKGASLFAAYRMADALKFTLRGYDDRWH